MVARGTYGGLLVFYERHFSQRVDDSIFDRLVTACATIYGHYYFISQIPACNGYLDACRSPRVGFFRERKGDDWIPID